MLIQKSRNCLPQLRKESQKQFFVTTVTFQSTLIRPLIVKDLTATLSPKLSRRSFKWFKHEKNFYGDSCKALHSFANTFEKFCKIKGFSQGRWFQNLRDHSKPLSWRISTLVQTGSVRFLQSQQLSRDRVNYLGKQIV